MNFVDTNYTNRVIRSVKEAVSNNDWLAVIGQVGAGKTTLFEKLQHFYREYPSRFIVVDLQRSLETFTISVNFILKRMIQEISPDATIPGNAHAKLTILKELLLSASTKKKKIILMLDESQVLKLSLLRDIKKIHEISSREQSHLFSIIMFGKNEGNWLRSLRGTEIGLRVRTSLLETMKKNEVIDFANRAYDLKWEQGTNGEKARQIFLKNIGDFSPLYIREQILKLQRDPNFNGLITYQLALAVFPQTFSDITKKNGISYAYIQKKYQDLTGKTISKPSLSVILSDSPDKNNYDSNTRNSVIEATLEAIKDKSKSDMDIIAAEGLASDFAIAQ